MAAQFKVGQLEVPGSTGTQVISGLGFTPTAIIFFGTATGSAGGTWDGNIHELIGFAADGSTERSLTNYSQDAQANSNTGRRDGGAAVALVTSTSTVTEASVTTYGSDGFTLTWATLQADHIGREVFYLAIGGVSAKIVDWTTPTTAIAKAVTGVGFQPDVAFHLTSSQTSSPPQTSVHAVASFGAMDADGGQWANGWEHVDNLGTSDTYRFQRTDRCLAWAFGGTVFEEAHFTSMDSDGFTVTFDLATSARHVYSLCLGGLEAKVGAFDTTQTTSPTTQAVTGMGFQPLAGLFSTFGGGGTTSIASQAVRSIGASDGTNHRAGGLVDEDALATTKAKAAGYVTKALLIPTTTPATYAAGDIDSFDSDGFTVGWDAATGAVAFQMVYVAFGPSTGFTGFGIPMGIA